MAKRMRGLLDDLRASLSRIEEAEKKRSGWFAQSSQYHEINCRELREFVSNYVSETETKLEAHATGGHEADGHRLPSTLSAQDFFDVHTYMQALDPYDEGPETPEGFGTAEFDYDSLPTTRWSPIINYVDSKFGDRLRRAFEHSNHRQLARVWRYGREVAENSRRGLTPSPARREWEARLEESHCERTLSPTDTEEDNSPTSDGKHNRKDSTPPSSTGPLQSPNAQHDRLDNSPKDNIDHYSSHISDEATSCGKPEQVLQLPSKEDLQSKKADSVEVDEMKAQSSGEIVGEDNKFHAPASAPSVCPSPGQLDMNTERHRPQSSKSLSSNASTDEKERKTADLIDVRSHRKRRRNTAEDEMGEGRVDSNLGAISPKRKKGRRMDSR